MPHEGDEDATRSSPQPSTRPMPEAVRDAKVFMKSAKMPSGSLSMEEILSDHMRLVEACQIYATWDDMPMVAEDATTAMDRRITSRNIFGKPGSATGEEAMAMLKAREEEKKAVAAMSAAKKEEQKRKKARDTTAEVFPRLPAPREDQTRGGFNSPRPEN